MITLNLKETVTSSRGLGLHLGLKQGQINRAIIIALKRTIAGISHELSSEIAKEAKVKKQLIKRRMRSAFNQRSLSASLSMLVRDIPAIMLGKPVKKGSGVMVGGIFFDGAFTAVPKAGHGAGRPYIFKRVRKSRYPLAKPAVEIKDIAKENFDAAEDQIRERFMKNIEYQLFRFKEGS